MSQEWRPARVARGGRARALFFFAAFELGWLMSKHSPLASRVGASGLRLSLRLPSFFFALFGCPPCTRQGKYQLRAKNYTVLGGIFTSYLSPVFHRTSSASDRITTTRFVCCPLHHTYRVNRIESNRESNHQSLAKMADAYGKKGEEQAW